MEIESGKLSVLFLKKDGNDYRTQGIINDLGNIGYNVFHAQNYQEALDIYEKNQKNIALVVAALGIEKDRSDNYGPLVDYIRFKSNNMKVFICIFSSTAAKNAQFRLDIFNNKKCNMVTECLQSLQVVAKQIKQIKDQNEGILTCPICQETGFCEDSLWLHLPLYHVNEENNDKKCPICKKRGNLAVHYRNMHGPCGRGEIESENQADVPLYSFSLVVVRRKSDGKYLLVQEFANSGFWLPGGRVDPGEGLSKAAVRECKEEAGIDIQVKGILTMQFQHKKSHARMRIIYYAEPVDENQMPKSIPDYESVGACYVSAKEIADLHLRGGEPLEWIPYVENQGTIYPLEVFSKEN